MKKIDIIVTLGPASLNKKFLNFINNKVSLVRLNMSHMEINKLKDAIKMFQKKIKKQGRVTNARDEEHLKNLIKVYKQMGGKGVKESVSEDHIKFSKEEMAQLHKDGKIEKGGHTIEFSESVNEGKKSKKAVYDIFGALKELIFYIKGLRKIIDDGPYNRLNSSLSGGLYKWEIDSEKKLRLFAPQLKKLAQDKMLESVNEGKKRFKVGFNIGKAKYVISHHDGREKHKDGSDFLLHPLVIPLSTPFTSENEYYGKKYFLPQK